MKTIIALLIIGCTLLGFSAYWLGYESYEPKTITEIKEVPADPVYITVVSPPEIKEVPKYYPQIVTENVTTIQYEPLALTSTDNVDFNRMLYMIELGIYSHQFELLNNRWVSYFPGQPTEQEWVDFYRQLQAIIKEIKGGG